MSRYIFCSIVFTIFLSSAFALVPSYIQVCGRRNPNLNKCVEESVEKLKPILRKGIPELDVPTMEVFDIGEVTLANITDFTAVSKNVKLRGLADFVIKNLNVDLDNQKIDIDLLFPKVHLDSDLTVNAKILVPINEKGPIFITSENVKAKASLVFKTVERRSRKLIYFPTMTTKVTVNDFTGKFREGTENNPLTQTINSVVIESKQEIIDSMAPNIEKAISLKVLDIANRICKHFTFQELFPDRT